MITLGQKLSPVLVEIQDTLLENYEIQPHFDLDAFSAILFMFQSAIMDKMYSLQDREEMSMEDRENMAIACGNEIKDLVKKFCDIDTFELFKELK